MNSHRIVIPWAQQTQQHGLDKVEELESEFFLNSCSQMDPKLEWEVNSNSALLKWIQIHHCLIENDE